MAFERTITSANSTYALSVIGLFDVPQLLRGYSADAAFDTDALEPAEVVKGVDGRMSAGWVPTMNRQTISIMPDSGSSDIFEAWNQAQKAAREVFWANAVITLPSLGKSYILTRGILTSFISIPAARKVMQSRAFTITWDDISPTPTV